MSNNIDLKQGLNIPISGAAVQKTRKTVSPDVIAVKPTDFKGLTPRPVSYTHLTLPTSARV